MSTDCCFMLLLINYSIVSYLDVLAGIGILDSQTQYTRNNSQIVAMLLLCCIHYWLWERQTETQLSSICRIHRFFSSFLVHLTLMAYFLIILELFFEKFYCSSAYDCFYNANIILMIYRDNAFITFTLMFYISCLIISYLQIEFKRITSPLKYQTRCVATFPDKQGFLVRILFVNFK